MVVTSNGKIVCKHGCLQRNLHVILKFTESTGIIFKKHSFLWRGSNIWRWSMRGSYAPNLERRKTKNGSHYIKMLFQKDSSYKWWFCSRVCAPPRLVFQIKKMSGQNIKMRYLMCQVPSKYCNVMQVQVNRT